MVTAEKIEQGTEKSREQPLLLSVDDVACILSIGRSAAWSMVSGGDVMSVRIGRRVLVPRTEVEAYVRRLIDRAASGDGE